MPGILIKFLKVNNNPSIRDHLECGRRNDLTSPCIYTRPISEALLTLPGEEDMAGNLGVFREFLAVLSWKLFRDMNFKIGVDVEDFSYFIQ